METATTAARKQISALIDSAKTHSEITSINALSHSFDFLNEEPELYAPSDLKKCDV